MQNGKLDVIIIAWPFEEPGIRTQGFYTEPLLVTNSHPWAKRRRVPADLLASETVLLPHAGHCLRRHVLEQCPEISQSDTGEIQGNSLETIRQMVHSGLGIASFPCSAVTKKFQGKFLKAIYSPTLYQNDMLDLHGVKGLLAQKPSKPFAKLSNLLRFPNWNQ
ncbi:LysR substrate-binding domain-containing protein [Candidatus Nitrospira salsa]